MELQPNVRTQTKWNKTKTLMSQWKQTVKAISSIASMNTVVLYIDKFPLLKIFAGLYNYKNSTYKYILYYEITNKWS